MIEQLKPAFRHDLELVDIATGEIVDRVTVFNRIPDAALEFLMLAPFGQAAPVSTFYCGLLRENFMPSGSMSSADIPTAMGEFIDYEEPTRPIWTPAYDNGVYSNIASPAIFTPTQDRSVRGSFIVSSATKGGNTGLLLSVARFPTVKQVSVGLEAKLKTGLTYMPVNSI